MTELGLTEHGNPDNVTFHTSATAAVEGAAFNQESVPERLPIKHALFARTEPAIARDAILASSASGLMPGQMQGGWKDPSRMVLGHPFNPPHLTPLVEVMANEWTADGVPEAFYKSIGKFTIRVRREVSGHVANRLQALSGARRSAWCSRGSPASEIWTRRCGPGRACAGRRWVRPCCPIWARVQAAGNPSATVSGIRSTAGGTICFRSI